jgi:hypothetical protein
VLLGRETSIPPRKTLKASSHRFSSIIRCLNPVLTGSRATFTRVLAKGGHTLLFRDAKGNLMSDP